MRLLIADPDASRRSKIAADPRLGKVFQAASLSEAFHLSEAEQPSAIAIAVELTGDVGLVMFLHLVDALSVPIVMYGNAARNQTPSSLRPSIEFVDFGAGDPPDRVLENTLFSKVASIASQDQAQGTPDRARYAPDVIVVGSSTGGVCALETILSRFPQDCPPTLVVQHITPGFAKGMIARLDERCAPRLVAATDGAPLAQGHVYFADDPERHLTVQTGAQRMCSLRDGPHRNGHRPSVDALFESVASLPSVAAALLTGMGSDGALGLAQIRDGGGLTIAQDAETSVVYGMPRAAVEGGAACQVLPVGAIAQALLSANAPTTATAASRRVRTG